MYSICSAVSVSMLIPSARSFRLAISVSTSFGKQVNARLKLALVLHQILN